MRNVYVISDNIISSLGFTTEENLNAFKAGQTGIKLHEEERISPSAFWASLVDRDKLAGAFSYHADPSAYTRFEQLLICSIQAALGNTAITLSGERVLFILSTTKGNIDLLDPKTRAGFEERRIYLWHTAQLVKRFFNLHNTPLVVSNACISGALAIIIGARLIRSGHYDHVVVSGGDLVTEFVLTGFNSFLSLCTGPCRPFDRDRQGLSLGEGAGTLILTSDRGLAAGNDEITAGPGYSSNDANHISGPSRTGEGLYVAVRRTLALSDRGVDYVSAHGTATPYNDEMESVALTRAGLQSVPVNSYKGYWGHTLGAAGIIESVAGIQSMRQNLLFNTLGYTHLGVTHPIAVVDKTRPASIKTFLKIASGFGGCNAALLFNK